MDDLRAGLAAIDWVSLERRDDPKIPVLLQAIRSADPAVRRSSYDRLAGLVVHQGHTVPVSPVVVPFLVDVVMDEALPDRFAACQVLQMIAVGDQERWFEEWPDQAVERLEVARQAQLTRAEREQEMQAWVDASPTEEGRHERAFEMELFDVDATFADLRTYMEAYDAVRAAVPSVLAALRSEESAVRLYAAALLAWFAEDQDVIVPALRSLIEGDRDPEVVAVACAAAGLCGRHSDDPALLSTLSRQRDSTHPLVRWSAVIALGLVPTHPDPATVEDLHRCVAEVDWTAGNWPFLDGDVAALASVVIADLSPGDDPDSVPALLRRLEIPQDLDDVPFVQALLAAAFPDGPAPAGTAFTDLTAAQQDAVAAIATDARIGDGAMMTMLLGRYHLPSAAELPGWSGLVTRPFADLDAALAAVPWSAVRHAYGPAVETSGLLRAIRAKDEPTRRGAYDELARLMFDGPRPSQVCPVVVPFLADVVVSAGVADRHLACRLLRMIAVPDQPRRLRTWAPASDDRHERESYEAVRAVVPSLLSGLIAKDTATRQYAASVLAWFPQQSESILPALVLRYPREPQVEAAAVMALAMGFCARRSGDPTVIRVLTPSRDIPIPAIRWSAVIALGLVSDRPDGDLAERLRQVQSEAHEPERDLLLLDGDVAGLTAAVVADLPT